MRSSLLQPISELELAAKVLDAAADALLTGHDVLARELISAANLPEITEYAKQLVGKMSEEVHRHTARPKCLPKNERDPTRMPSKSEQDVIFARDGWRCRFCGTKVICKSARSVIARHVSLQPHWISLKSHQHSALYAMASSLDHVIPHGRGGKNEFSNYVTACYCCQFSRGEWTLEEVQLADPRSREAIVDSWDGLSRLAKLQRKSASQSNAHRGATTT